MRDTLASCAALEGVRRLIAFTPPDAEAWFAALDPAAELVAQPAGDLGSRLQHAFAHAFASGAPAAAAIGSDTPHLGPAVWRAALARIAPGRVVLGPTDDGGYYFIGLAAPAPALFESIDWSTERVLAQTVAQARTLDLAVDLLEPSFDVDVRADLDRLVALTGDSSAIRLMTEDGPTPS